jgi:phosphatidylserine decarboxylase
MDGKYKRHYRIEKDSTIKEITIKGTHKIASIPDLLANSAPGYKNAFANGMFVHYFLSPYSHHRFHAPVAGVVRECYQVSGFAYLDVNIGKGAFQAPDNSEDGYEFQQSRGVLIIDTKESTFGNIGLVAIIPIGMANVSSVNMTVPIRDTKPIFLQKGDEFGYFLFGGSDIIVLFQIPAEKQILTKPEHPPTADPDYFHYGIKIADFTAT